MTYKLANALINPVGREKKYLLHKTVGRLRLRVLITLADSGEGKEDEGKAIPPFPSVCSYDQ